MESQNKLFAHKRWWVALCLLALTLVYVFQKVDYVHGLLSLAGAGQWPGPITTFIINKTVRLILNDLICFFLIYILFREKKYLRIAFLVFCVELFFILPLYFVIKLSVEGDSEISSPLLSQIHRLIVNPMLMLLVIVAFYYQKSYANRKE